MGGNADPAWGFAPMAEGADWCGFFLAAPVRRFTELSFLGTWEWFGVGMGGERRFASLLRIGGPGDWEFLRAFNN